MSGPNGEPWFEQGMGGGGGGAPEVVEQRVLRANELLHLTLPQFNVQLDMQAGIRILSARHWMKCLKFRFGRIARARQPCFRLQAWS